MEDSQHDHLLCLGDVENRIGKATCPNMPDLPVLDRVSVRVLGSKLDRTVYLGDELCSQAGLAILVPHCRIVELGSGGGPKDDLEDHLFRRAEMDALTTSQGTTSSGWVS